MHVRIPKRFPYCAAEESQSWLDPVWAAALEEVSVCLEHDTKVTIRAVNRDERRAMLRIKQLTPSRVQAIILSPHEPGAMSQRPPYDALVLRAHRMTMRCHVKE